MALKEANLIEDEAYLYLRDCVSYLKKHVASAQEDLREESVHACLDFLEKYEKNLPASKLAAYGDLQRKAREITVRFSSAIVNSISRRDQQMASYVRDRRSATGLNFMVVGAAHATGIGNHLADLPVMLMVPRAMIQQEPANKDEL